MLGWQLVAGFSSKRTIDEIDTKEMILPLVVIDVHDKAAKNSSSR
jgi:hypothetical protein